MIADPTMLMSEEKAQQVAIAARFRSLASVIRSLIVEEDAFGLIREVANVKKTPLRSLPTPKVTRNRKWKFLSDSGKVEQFNTWLRDKIDRGILQAVEGSTGAPWLSVFVKKGYEKGAARTLRDIQRLRSARSKPEAAAALGSLIESSSVGQMLMTSTDALKFLFTRQFVQLKGITEGMAGTMSRIFAEGLIGKKTASEIAKSLVREIGITQGRAYRLARTEMTYAHAEGQLDALVYMGHGRSRLKIVVEWRTASMPCSLCASLSKGVYTVQEARGLIPRHPNCRCAWAIVNLYDKKPKGQVRGAVQLRAMILESVKQETGKRLAKDATRASYWPGATLMPTGKRSLE